MDGATGEVSVLCPWPVGTWRLGRRRQLLVRRRVVRRLRLAAGGGVAAAGAGEGARGGEGAEEGGGGEGAEAEEAGEGGAGEGRGESKLLGGEEAEARACRAARPRSTQRVCRLAERSGMLVPHVYASRARRSLVGPCFVILCSVLTVICVSVCVSVNMYMVIHFLFLIKILAARHLPPPPHTRDH